MVIAAGTAKAQGQRMFGVVTASSSGEPIPFATVQIEGTNLGVMADSVGRFMMMHLSDGPYSVIVSAVGYRTQRLPVTITESESLELSPVLEETRINTGGIVVTGTRTPRYVKDAPVFTEVVSKASIESKSADNIFEALEGESGVRVEQQCQACNFSVLRMQGLGADHAQVLLDGHPVYSGLASVYGLQQLSTAEVDRIEIVKGAGSALHGGNAVAGAINIVSSVPRKTEGKVGVEFGQHNTNRYSLRAGTRKDNLGLLLFAQQSEQDELDETGDVNAPGGVNGPDGWMDRVRASSRNIGFNLFLDDLFASDRLVIRGRLIAETRLGGRLTDRQFENPFAPGTERIMTDRTSGQVEYELWLPGGFDMSTNLSIISHQRDATNDTFLGDYEEAYGEAPSIDLLRPYVADEDLMTAGVNLVKPLGGRHRILLGMQMSRNELKESGMYLDIESEQPYLSSSRKRAYEFGAFVQDEFRMSNRLEVVAGFRLDYHSSEDEFHGSGNVMPKALEPLEYEETVVNPRMAVKYSISDALVLRGSAGSGFRVPYGFSEDLHLCSGSPRVYKGGNLKPEKSFSYALSADYTVSSMTATLNVYRTELAHAIGFTDAGTEAADLGYTYEWRNIDDAYVTGLEFNSSASVAPGLVIGARFEVFEGKYDNPRDDWLGTGFEDASRNISRYPQTAGGLKADYTIEKWNLVADADYKGKMYIDLTEPADPSDVRIHETEPFVILNAKVGRWFADRYNVYLGVSNLTDYTQKEKHIDDAAFMYAPMYGRLFYGGIQVSL
jgi:outer membrane receptor for ferrienterochelin and colicins